MLISGSSAKMQGAEYGCGLVSHIITCAKKLVVGDTIEKYQKYRYFYGIDY